ncbi:hypothetical protein LOTGIDRAFT_156779 [Lottia gigantea]|uniref:Uncharacterized protein n=1 Tax=Lottia gigantea TaxID=225164 RepID=V4CKQ5_LOTGI|nr:hypothetical protein LOTGIDRAFT_156779 [Lottia gigantea]ESP02830.1 hypothetical protein LOTGIDRAFT_156779 [Lottia gigantea]
MANKFGLGSLSLETKKPNTTAWINKAKPYFVDQIGDTLQGDLDMNNFKVTNLKSPENDNDTVHKKYLRDQINSMEVNNHLEDKISNVKRFFKRQLNNKNFINETKLQQVKVDSIFFGQGFRSSNKFNARKVYQSFSLEHSSSTDLFTSIDIHKSQQDKEFIIFSSIIERNGRLEVGGFTSKQKSHYKKKTEILNTYLNKLFIFFERSREDKNITIEELEKFNEILDKFDGEISSIKTFSTKESILLIRRNNKTLGIKELEHNYDENVWRTFRDDNAVTQVSPLKLNVFPTIHDDYLYAWDCESYSERESPCPLVTARGIPPLPLTNSFTDEYLQKKWKRQKQIIGNSNYLQNINFICSYQHEKSSLAAWVNLSNLPMNLRKITDNNIAKYTEDNWESLRHEWEPYATRDTLCLGACLIKYNKVMKEVVLQNISNNLTAPSLSLKGWYYLYHYHKEMVEEEWYETTTKMVPKHTEKENIEKVYSHTFPFIRYFIRQSIKGGRVSANRKSFETNKIFVKMDEICNVLKEFISQSETRSDNIIDLFKKYSKSKKYKTEVNSKLKKIKCTKLMAFDASAMSDLDSEYPKAESGIPFLPEENKEIC